MKLKFKWTVVAILIFIVVFFWGRSAEAGEVGIGLAFGLPSTRSEGMVAQELMLKTDDYRWYASYMRVGKNDNDRLVSSTADRLSAGYQLVFRRGKDWEPYMMLGAAYFKNAPERLISERLTYDMRVGIRYKGIVEFDVDGHNSTAGRADRNNGVDLFQLRAVFAF